MSKVITSAGDMFIVVSVESEVSVEGQEFMLKNTVTVPMTFCTIEDAMEFCDEAQVDGREFLIFGVWYPRPNGKVD